MRYHSGPHSDLHVPQPEQGADPFCFNKVTLFSLTLLSPIIVLHSTEQEKPTVSLIRTHIASEPDVLHQLMSSLFNTLLLTTHANHWAITRPILSLMLASEASFAGTFHSAAQWIV